MRGRKPEYRPRFSESDLERIGVVLRQSNAPYSQVRRAKLAKLLASEPNITSLEAARRLEVHHQFVRKWRRRWAKKGFVLQDMPRPGRPRVFSPDRHRGR